MILMKILKTYMTDQQFMDFSRNLDIYDGVMN